MNYKLYQMDNSSEHCFMCSDYIKNFDQEINIHKYNEVYSGTVKDEYYIKMLDGLFTKFNIEHPDDFSGHSMSVSDVVVLYETSDECEIWFCDGLGWKLVNKDNWYSEQK